MFSGKNGQTVITCQANGAITARHAVKAVGDAAGLMDVSQATTDTDEVVGFALESAADNATVQVCVNGPCEALAGEALAVGTAGILTSTGSGKLKAYAYGDRPCAYFLGAKKASSTAADGDIINVVVLHAPLDTGV